MRPKSLKSVAAAVWLSFALVFGQTPSSDELTTPDSYKDRIRKSGSFLEMSLNDAIRLALTNNLELEIENYNEDLTRMRVFGTRGYYDPVVRFSLGWISNTRPSTSILDAGSEIPTTIFKNWSFDSRLTQNLVGGGVLTVDFNNDRSTTNSAFSFINPQFGSAFAINYTQPLWRGFRQTSVERQLKIYNLDTEISDSQFKQRVSEIIQQVENQYWELVFAIENFEARRSSLELAIVQYRNNQKRVEIGVMAPIEITSSRAEVATREQEMIQSEVQIINAQNALKRLLAPDPRASLWSLTILPTEQPQVRDVAISLEDAIETALQRRPELEQLRFELEKVEVDRRFYRKDGKPSVNLRFGLTSNGTAGRVLRSIPVDTDGDGVPDTVIPDVPQVDSPFYGNFSDAWGQSFKFDFLSYVTAIDVEIPLRNRTNEAQLAQVAISERQVNSRIRNTQQSIIVDVRNAFEGIHTRKKGLEAARVARQLTEEQLQGENKRFEAGLSTNFEVLRYQRDLADAQVRELRAMIDYQIALTALQKATFTIIDENDIVTARRDQARQN
jgi:HAE1 family hydrophobic/amphiphilic exporter-1